MSAALAITTVLVILAIVVVVGNFIVCLIIKKNRDMRNPMNYLLVNLAIADIIYAVFITPRMFYQLHFAHHPDGVFGTVLCKIVSGGSFAWTGSGCSIVTLVAIAIERYYAVMYPLSNKWSLTNRKVRVIIPVTWMSGFLFNLPLYLAKDIVKMKSGITCVTLFSEAWMGKSFTTSWFVGIILLLLLMTWLYARVVYTLWFKRDANGQPAQQQQGVMKVRKRVTLMVIAVTAIFGICWGTGQLIYVLLYFIPADVGTILLAISDVMILFNSAVNPFVYALMNQQFREKMKKMICCSLMARVHPEAHSTDSAENTTHPTHAVT